MTQPHPSKTLLRAALLAAASLVIMGTASAQTVTVKEAAGLTGPDRQARLEKGARAEGEFMFYTSLIVDQAVIPLKEAFEKKYPFIKFNFNRATSSSLIQRILSETRAGKPQADVVIGSTSAGLAQADLLHAFSSPELAAYPKDYLGKNGLWMTYRLAYYGIGYNTKMVPPADAPQTWDDVLNPKWKGKMIWGTSLETGGTFLIQHLRNSWGEKKAAEFYDKLATQQVARSDASVRALLDLVIAGEYAILLTTSLNHAIISAGQGAPVWFSMPDPVAARPDDMQLLKNAPHPHAAMLFIDYILSKEGQELIAKIEYMPARPDVAPIPSMVPSVPHLNGKKAIVYTGEEMFGDAEELKKIMDKISP